MLTIVTGPPCSGKSTYVRQHALPGDVIIDFDRIAQAFGSGVSHGHGRHHWKVTIEARDAAITAAIGCHLKGARVWVVDSRPPDGRLRHYQAKGGTLVNLDASPAELHRRADQAGRPASWHARIDTFLAGPDPLPSARTRW